MWIHITRPFIYKVSGCLFIVIITVFLETVLHIITFFSRNSSPDQGLSVGDQVGGCQKS